MRLFCWNVNSLVPTVRNVNLKYGSLAAFFAHLDADIVCMQEVKLPDSKLTKELVIVEGYQSYWACSQNKTGYSGVTTWVREGWAAGAAEADPFSCEGCDKEGRAIVTDHGTFVLFNLYVPNAGDRPARARLPAKLSFLAALKERVDDLLGAGRQVVLVGDFNIAAEKRDVHDALSWDTMYHPSELQALQALMGPDGSNCRDTWRVLHPQIDGVYTVWNEKTSARAFNVGLRIDYALVSSGLLDKVTSSEVLLDLPPKWSDHAPLLLELNLPAPYTAAAAAADGQAVAEQSDQQQQQQRPPECAMWQALVRRFQDPSQRSIAAMFRAAGKPKPAAKQAKGAAAAPPAASAASMAAAAAAAAAAASGADSVSKPPAAAAATAPAAGASGSVTAAAAPAAAATAPAAGRAGDAAAVSQQLGEQGSAAKASSASIPTPAVTAAGEASDPLLGDARQQVDQQADQQQQQSSQPSQQQQQEKQPPQVQQQPRQQQRGRGQGVAGSVKSTGRQAAAGKRKAGSNGDTAAVKGPKQAKLQSFFARAASDGG